MLFKIQVRLELSWIKKEKEKKEIPGRDGFFPGGGLNSEHRTREILCMAYGVLSLVYRNEYTYTLEFYFLIRNTRPGQMVYRKCGPR